MNFLKPLIHWFITQPFKPGIHEALDLRASENTPIRAVHNGTIHNTYFNHQGGKQILINHDNNYRSGYAHLNEIHVVPGQTVKKGDIIGLSGNTGFTTGAHLHFTMRKNGQKIDPELLEYAEMKNNTLLIVLSCSLLFLILNSNDKKGKKS